MTNCNRSGRGSAWPFFAAAMAANASRRGRRWDFAFDGDTFGPGGPFGPDGPFGPKGPFGPNGPFGPGGGKRRGRMFGQGELRLVLLHLVSEQPRHGYELIKALGEMTLGAYEPSPGTVYPTLALLEDEGMIEHVPGADSRKPYQVTEDGRRELAEKSGELEALLGRLDDRAGERKPFASPDLFRAAGNLAAVLKNKVREGRFDETTREQVVDMIDELARRIEKL